MPEMSFEAYRFAPSALLAVMLCGCGMSSLTHPFRSEPEAPKQAWGATVSEDGLLQAAKANPSDDVETASAAAGNCPRFVAWPKDRYVTVYETGKVGDGTAVVHRGEVLKTARSCEDLGGRLTVKYGFSGRVLLGPKGHGGSIALPVKVYVQDSARKVVSTETMRVTTSATPDNPVGYFSVVREVSFNVAPGTRAGDYKLFVAFEKKGPGAA